MALLLAGSPNALGEAIRRLRGKRTQVALAEAAGMVPSTLSEYERGRRVPRPKQLQRILVALGCDSVRLEEELRRMDAEVSAKTAGETPLIATDEMLKDVDRELREVEHEIDRHETRRKLLLLLRQHLGTLPPGTRVGIRAG